MLIDQVITWLVMMMMGIQIKIMKDIRNVQPQSLGWLEVKLDKKEMNFLWDRVKEAKGNEKQRLAGNITASLKLIDKDNWFWENVLYQLIFRYGEEFEYNPGLEVPVSHLHKYMLGRWWVNYQKEHEFNPIHNHTGVYSFIVWMKIPTRYKDQLQNRIARVSNDRHSISNFKFEFLNILGDFVSYTYEMDPELEGTLLFFPSRLNHSVYPFYNCRGDRISISGNIILDSMDPK